MLKDSHINMYKIIKKYINHNGYSPSVRELQDLCHYGSTSTVTSHLDILEMAGYIKRKRNIPRSIIIIAS